MKHSVSRNFMICVSKMMNFHCKLKISKKKIFLEKNEKKIFLEKNEKKNFGKNWFVKECLAFIKNWWCIIKLHSLVYMETYFWHHFMTYKMKKEILKKKIRKKFFFEKNLICEKVTSISQKMIINHKMSISGLYGNVF